MKKNWTLNSHQAYVYQLRGPEDAGMILHSPDHDTRPGKQSQKTMERSTIL